MSGKLALLAVPLIVTLAHATGARAADDEAQREDAAPEVTTPEGTPSESAPREQPQRDDAAPGRGARGAAAYYPPSVDGPALRLPEALTRVYADATGAVANDLTALPYIAGRAYNLRLAAGGAWRWRRLVLDGQLTVNRTWINVTSVLNQDPLPEDKKQTKISLGDMTLGATWTERLTDGEALIGGLSVRGRLPTHTTRFQFHLNDGSIADFVIPYYFHVEPTVVLGGAAGPFTYVMNQGAIVLLGPDANFDTEHITVPTIYLYDAHYAVGVAPWPFLGASIELATMIQLNHVAGVDFQKFNDIRAVWVAPAVQVHVFDLRIDLMARIGASRGQELYGVLEYVGTHSIAIRVTHFWN